MSFQVFCLNHVLLFAGDDKIVLVWDAETGTQMQALQGHTGMINCVQFGNDGNVLVSGGCDNWVVVWDLVSASNYVLDGHTDAVQSVSISPDGLRVVSASRDKTVCVWELGTRAVVKRLEGHTDKVWCVVWSHDGRRVVSGSHDKNVHVWWSGLQVCYRICVCMCVCLFVYKCI
jgi:WD40 repeat protein